MTKPPSRTNKPSHDKNKDKTSDHPADENGKGERIAKYLARAGVCSRRDAEKLIEEGAVSVNGKKLATPAFWVTPEDVITVKGKPVSKPQKTRLWLYHKPRGLVTTHKDEEGRETVFQQLPRQMPRVVSVGRLDLNSEGLLLLTNNGALSRHLELPSTALPRTYRVRAFGDMTPRKLEQLAKGITIDGVNYGSIKTEISRRTGDNVWLIMTLHEGKNREIRRVLEFLGLKVNRLIRTSYGPFELTDMPINTVVEVPHEYIKRMLGEEFA